MSSVQDRQLVLQAVLMVLWQRDDKSPVILHSDRGCQFTNGEYQRFLAGHNLTCSMSGVGSCVDNAVAEGFFGMLKRERVNRRNTGRVPMRGPISSITSSASIIRENGEDWKCSSERKYS